MLPSFGEGVLACSAVDLLILSSSPSPSPSPSPSSPSPSQSVILLLSLAFSLSLSFPLSLSPSLPLSPRSLSLCTCPDHMFDPSHRSNKTVWPSGLRRWLQAPVRKGVGSNPTAVTLCYRKNLASFLILASNKTHTHKVVRTLTHTNKEGRTHNWNIKCPR